MQPAEATNPDRFSGRGANRSFFLPRLAQEYYQGAAVVHWTLTLARRATGWLNAAFHFQFREVMLHAAWRESLFCPVYCLMPDHIHLIWLGLRRDSNQRNAMKFLREHLAPSLHPFHFQHQAHDHVLREEERKQGAFARVCFYVLANPVRDGLIQEGEVWPYGGAIIPGYPSLHPRQDDFWPKFWRILAKSQHPDAGLIKHP